MRLKNKNKTLCRTISLFMRWPECYNNLGDSFFPLTNTKLSSPPLNKLMFAIISWEMYLKQEQPQLGLTLSILQ